jgi:site-specific DNA recombinase
MAPRGTVKPDPKRAIGYIRASTDKQDLSPDAQRQSMVEWCEAHQVVLVEVFVDEAVSGGAPLDKRPGLLLAIDALRSRKAGVLLVARRCRLTRDVVVGAMVERLVEKKGARIVAANGVGNGHGPEAQLMRRIIDAVSEYERALIRVRTRAALGVKRRRGERVGAVPFGYKLDDDGATLFRDIDEQKVIEVARGLRADGLSYQAIAHELEHRGFKPRSEGRWYPTQVRRMLQREEEREGF